jgi:two-component system NarL family response regulator
MSARILLADDHKLFTDSLQFLLHTYGFEVVGVAENGFEAVRKAAVLRPDIVLMDIRMPKCDGIDALKRIKAEMPHIKVVILTTSEEDEDLLQAIKWGASGYLLKSLNGVELMEMLLDLENGGAPISPQLTARLLKAYRHCDTPNRALIKGIGIEQGVELTERQIEVINAVAQMATYKEAGKTLGISERTVKYHMASIMEQLQMESKAQVIAFAAKQGWIDGEG